MKKFKKPLLFTLCLLPVALIAGWFTALEGGDPVSEATVVTEDITYYAHWTQTHADIQEELWLRGLSGSEDSFMVNQAFSVASEIRDPQLAGLDISVG